MEIMMRTWRKAQGKEIHPLDCGAACALGSTTQFPTSVTCVLDGNKFKRVVGKQ